MTLCVRHERLRTTFLQKDGRLRQVIHDADALSIEVEYLDLSAGNLDCKVTEYSDGMTIEMNYNAHAYERERVSDQAKRSGRILEGFVHNRLLCD